MPITLSRPVLIVAAAAALSGCASHRALTPTSTPTPSVALYIQSEYSATGGNGLWIGDRVLTAHHVLASDDGALPDRVQIDDQLAHVQVVTSGDAGVLRDRHAENIFARRQEDWIVASVGGRAPRETPEVLPGDGSVRPGERLYMVGYDIQSGEGGVRTVELRAPRELDSDVAVPRGVTIAMLPRVDDWRGWSGSFVGRYIEKGDGGQWEFVGVASSGMMDAKGRTQVLTIVRPPEDVVRAFFAGGASDVPVLEGEPGPLALPVGYHATGSVPVVYTDDEGQRFMIDVCVARHEAQPRRVLVSIGGCDPGVGWVVVGAVEGIGRPEDTLEVAPR
ncbi:MAG: hypothetical protein KF902_01500 [Phycisphaeraceae bacterium]|nr:hypothetical protein [Phycisphaeraceae bacterium]